MMQSTLSTLFATSSATLFGRGRNRPVTNLTGQFEKIPLQMLYKLNIAVKQS